VDIQDAPQEARFGFDTLRTFADGIAPDLLSCSTVPDVIELRKIIGVRIELA
jgi:hypothetical protein